MPSLSWGSVAYGDTYTLEYSTSSSFASGNTTVTGLGTGYTFGSPLADGHYYWRVESVNAYSDMSAWSATRDFIVDTAGPAAPTLSNPANAAIVRGTTTFSWSAPATAAGYEFEYSTDIGFGTTVSDVVQTGVSTVVSNPARGSYYWRVRAKDGLGNWGGWSAVWSFAVHAPIPGAPGLVSPAAGYQTTNTMPSLSWGSVTNGATYELEYSTSSSFASGNTTVTGLGTGYTFGSPLADGHYYWRARADNLDGESGAWSATRDFIVDTAGPAAPTLTGPANAAILRGTTTFSWSAPATAAGYEFEYSTDIGFGTTVSDVVQTGVSTVVSNPARGSYYWRVRAKDGLGNWGGWSAAWTFAVHAPIPAAPALSAPASGYMTESTTPMVSWLAAANGATYQVQFSTTSTFATIGQSGTTGSLEFTPTTLAFGTWYWRVQAMNLDSEAGAWSSVRSFTSYPSFYEEFGTDANNWFFDSSDWTAGGGNLQTDGIQDSGCLAPSCYVYNFATYNGPTTDFKDFTFRVRMRRDLHVDTTSMPPYVVYSAPQEGIFIRASEDSYGELLGGYMFTYWIQEVYDPYYYVTYVYSTWELDKTLAAAPWFVTVASGQLYYDGNFNFEDYYNVARATAIGSTMYFYLNNTLMYTLNDSAFAHGNVGIEMLSDQYGDNTIYADYARLGLPNTSPISGESLNANLRPIAVTEIPKEILRIFVENERRMEAARRLAK
jgi:hypothetical protein